MVFFTDPDACATATGSIADYLHQEGKDEEETAELEEEMQCV